MKAVVAANSAPASSQQPRPDLVGGVLLCNTTALITKTDGDEEVDIYSELGRNVKYFVRMHVETDDYIFLEHFWPSNREVTHAALVLEEVAAAGDVYQADASGPS